MYASSLLLGYVRMKLARFVGCKGRQCELHPVDQASEQLDADWEIMESQKMLISKLAIENSQKLTEIDHLEDQLKWLHAVVNAANIKLSDYDYLRKPRGPKTPAQRVSELKSRRKRY